MPNPLCPARLEVEFKVQEPVASAHVPRRAIAIFDTKLICIKHNVFGIVLYCLYLNVESCVKFSMLLNFPLYSFTTDTIDSSFLIVVVALAGRQSACQTEANSSSQ